MYSSSDFERLHIKYQCEAVPKGISIQSFCHQNNVPYNLYAKWYKDTRQKIVPVRVDNQPQDVHRSEAKKTTSAESGSLDGIKILVDIKMSNGMHIRQGGINYDRLKSLVEKLEVLC